MNIKELAKEVQKMRSLQREYFATQKKTILGESKTKEKEIDALVEKILAEPERATDIAIEQINGVDYVSLEQLRKVTGISAEELARAGWLKEHSIKEPPPPHSDAPALSPSDFGPYLADELEQFDRYLAEFRGGVNFKEWAKTRIDEALHDWEMSS
jgi:hypothetical protein